MQQEDPQPTADGLPPVQEFYRDPLGSRGLSANSPLVLVLVLSEAVLVLGLADGRRIAMRFEKLAVHYLGMVTLASILVWLA